MRLSCRRYLTLAATTSLLLVTLSDCTDKQNPVLPPSSGGPQGPAGISAPVVPDAAAAAPDTAATAPTNDDANGDALVGATCSLIRQDCADGSKACYPVEGSGMCLTMIAHRTAAASCNDNRECDKGLLCAHLVDLSAAGVCQAICDLTVASACLHQACEAASGLPPGVGLCPSL